MTKQELHLAEVAPKGVYPHLPVRRRRSIAIGTGAGIVIAFAGLVAWRSQVSLGPGGDSHAAQVRDGGQTAGRLPALPAPDLLRPLSPQAAQAINDERPIVDRPDEPAARFRLSGDSESRARATDCLAQAVYYEAASEGPDGERAVAQVVLNRVRHPGYPNSVCGVVYQGSEGATGCQFTFTCDGSLAHAPIAFLWARARRIASEALAGRVFAPVGHATHYHADYVVPYWSDSLDKVAVIGRHIFYRLRGSVGARAAFSQAYSNEEPAPPLPPPSTEMIAQSLEAADPPAVAATPSVKADEVQGLGAGEAANTGANAALQADIGRGELIVGGPSPSPKSTKKPSDDCPARGSGRLMPLGAQNLSVRSSDKTC